ncbi:efflux RND transporter periplasmic adaptor subunit [Parabacteroides sp. FAFU027]|uniref:efflux RND transporter periplasmic adaptor subunit n=1 Tax=Parabacteroides sp. FAFU027 TaxID=2922715 RepID=UPI001FAEC3AB|nr:efflux RND transporter periplasmic adaptor subunit [Parabacteroides sp. FAFU027]
MKSLISTALLTVVIGMTSCSSKEKNEAVTDDTKPVPVVIATPSGNSGSGILLSGKLESENTANISTRVMGYISSIRVKVGDRVQKGALLATISSKDIQAKKAQAVAMIAAAEAAYKNAAKDYNRFQTLHKQQSASDKELENVTLQYTAAKSNLEAARQGLKEVNAMLSYTNITAPFSGVITQKLADEGSMANPGMPLLILEQNGLLRLSATVSESDINQINVGEVAQVDIKSTGKSFQGKITELSPSSQATGGQYVVKITIPANQQKELLSGMYANATVAGKSTGSSQSGSIQVPVASIVNRDQLTGLYVVSDKNKASLRWVRLGKVSGDQVEVLSGLNANERFVLQADGKLYNGVTVVAKN